MSQYNIKTSIQYALDCGDWEDARGDESLKFQRMSRDEGPLQAAYRGGGSIFSGVHVTYYIVLMLFVTNTLF